MYSGIVFKGGGVKGIAYAGALKVLEDRGILKGLRRTAGASAGAITAMLVAKRLDAAGVKEIVWNMDFSRFKDSPNPLRVAEHYGYFKGEVAGQWLEVNSAVGLKPAATFADYEAAGCMDLRVVTSEYDTCFEKIYSYRGTPGTVVSEAVRASMSIPFYFAASQPAGSTSLQCDGGAIMNYPIDIFDAEVNPAEILGLYLTDYSAPTLPHLDGGHPIEAAERVIEMMMNAQDRLIRRIPEIMGRTVLIDSLGISATAFDLTGQQKNDLFKSGAYCTDKFFQ